MAITSETFSQFGPNSGYIEELYDLYQNDPALVGEKWANFFLGVENGSTDAHEPPLTSTGTNGYYQNGTATAVVSGTASAETLSLQERADQLVQAYFALGHLRANINPLSQGVRPLPPPADLDLEKYNFTDAELNTEVRCQGFKGQEQMQLRALIAGLETVYCDRVGFEYTHITSLVERNWLRLKIENRHSNGLRLTDAQKKRILGKLIDAEALESELHRKYVGHKRFSLQGGETLIPMLDVLLEDSALLGVREVNIGMAHRGRLTVLRNTVGMPLENILSEFEDIGQASALGAGDVKYHLGYTANYCPPAGKPVKVTLAPNPSHLEFVNPVVEGMTRAKQDLLYERDRNSAIPLQIHGDAAFAGQGVVYETLNFAGVEGYATGGTIHIVINNQVGFTTNPDEARTSIYCTDMAKGIEAPVFHINCEDVESAYWCVRTALQYRHKFGKSVILDLYCYRKYGHNEGDDPSYTQPLLYAEIQSKKSIAQLYAETLIAEGVVTEADQKALHDSYVERFETVHRAKNTKVSAEVCSTVGVLRGKSPKTGVKKEVLERIARTLVEYPDGFTPHPKLQKILEKRVQSITEGEGIDWGFAEVLAFGSLVIDGCHVRLSGQDCGRGTFSQRHILLSDYKQPVRYLPLAQLGAKVNGSNPPAFFEVYNSVLSEAAIMGFEFGYSASSRNSLVLWEAQFGDFSNGAQVIIDQFIASSEAKWSQYSGLTLLLPHGFEGQGPEHSSARLERYLQLCADGNIQVCYPSSAAQHFHLMRRQGLMPIRRPLIVMTPKSLLRMPEASAKLDDLIKGEFQPVMPRTWGKAGKSSKVILFSGKIGYDLMAALEKAKTSGVKTISVEQLYPFPEVELKAALEGCDLKNVYWLQEEPQNMGGWSFVSNSLRTHLKIDAQYFGRPVSASPATGSLKRHTAEQQKIVQDLVKAVSN